MASYQTSDHDEDDTPTPERRPVVLSTTGDLAASRETVFFCQLAECPLILVHVQSLDAGLSLTPLFGDADIVLARHLGFAGATLPVLVATDLASARDLAGAATAIADSLQTPVVLLLSADTPEAIVHSIQTEAVEGRHSAMELLRVRGADPAGTAKPTLDAIARPGCVSLRCELGDHHAFLNMGQCDVSAHLQWIREKISSAGEILERTLADPDPEAETLLISYGHADYAARQAVKIVREHGARVSHLTVHSLWPLPQKALKRAVTPFVRRVLLPELNMGLYAEELSKLLRSVKLESLTRYDGHPIEPETIARRITDWPCG